MFYLPTHPIHFNNGYMAWDIIMVKDYSEETSCCHHYMGYSFRIPAWVILYASSRIHDSTYHGFVAS